MKNLKILRFFNKMNDGIKVHYFSYKELINTKYHIFQIKFILNIFKQHNFKIQESPLFIEDFPRDSKNILENYIKDYNFVENQNAIYIFNSLDYYLITNNITQENIEGFERFLNNIRYIVFHYENFTDTMLEQIGYPKFNQTFSSKKNILVGEKRYQFKLLYFKKSIFNILQNYNNIEILKGHKLNNLVYYPCIGYSKINNYIPLVTNEFKEIDILIYGNGLNYLEYRTNMYRKLKSYCEKNNIKIHYAELLYENKNNLLKNTNMVVHIPISKEAKKADCWCKIMELMCKKIFFIVEENDEIYSNNTINLLETYKHNDIEGLIKKINYYLDINHINEKNDIINKCYDYVKTNYNIDLFVKNQIIDKLDV